MVHSIPHIVNARDIEIYKTVDATSIQMKLQEVDVLYIYIYYNWLWHHWMPEYVKRTRDGESDGQAFPFYNTYIYDLYN